MDQATSLNGSQMTLRNCIIMQFLTSCQCYLLRYRCGYEKLVHDKELVRLLEESTVHKAARKKRMCNLVALADAEEHTLTNVVPATHTEVPLQPQQKGKEDESDTSGSATLPLEMVCDYKGRTTSSKEPVCSCQGGSE